MRHRFRGQIAGVGSASGHRVVVGHWRDSPLGPFSDVMLARPDGTRLLLAPSHEVADYVASTYTFDEVLVVPVEVHTGGSQWHVRAGDLDLRLDLGGRAVLGRLLRLMPRPVAESPGWTLLTDPVARLLLRGVRTRGSAGGGRREWYGATDLRRVTGVHGAYAGDPLGRLAPVTPDPGFGFGSTPARPSVTQVVTTIDLP